MSPWWIRRRCHRCSCSSRRGWIWGNGLWIVEAIGLESISPSHISALSTSCIALLCPSSSAPALPENLCSCLHLHRGSSRRRGCECRQSMSSRSSQGCPCMVLDSSERQAQIGSGASLDSKVMLQTPCAMQWDRSFECQRLKRMEESGLRVLE